MRMVLVVSTLLLLLTGHWGWAMLTLLLLLALSAVRTGGGTDDAAAPETPVGIRLEPYARPAGPADPDYGLDVFAFDDWLARPDVRGTPGGGLGAATGMAAYNVQAGVEGERSMAHMLATLPLDGARVYLSCRNPADTTGEADIDAIVATGDTVWLLDAKHYTPARSGMWLVPTPGLGDRTGAGELRAYGPDVNIIGTPLPALDRIAPERTYHASGNMAWAADAIRRALPGVNVVPVVLLSRTNGGVYGVARGTVFPGGVPVSTADRWRDGFASRGAPSIHMDTYLTGLVKR